MTNIRDFEKFRAAYWDWTPFNSCFGDTGIRISDIDGHVERKGHFLWIETTENHQISLGQRRSILGRVSRGDSALVIYGPPNKPGRLEFYRPWQQTPERMAPCELRHCIEVVARWYAWANCNGQVRELAAAQLNAAGEVTP